jgi:hypothetical protein
MGSNVLSGTCLAKPDWGLFTEAVMEMQHQAELVADPVGHISISGVHGRDELNHRLAHPPRRQAPDNALAPVLVGAAIGAVLMYLLKR